ncbi:hypothetical protein ACSDR0_45845 [Streptosporangium sp. G11]|uniref:hypothetical protein n=1 Tax=Streptosporangium sp. G11 TaxID=3436926 RepID=UPI003EB733D8
MNDLQMISTMLAKPDPSDEAVREGRRRLQSAQRRPGRGNVTWLTGVMGLTTVAGAAVAVAIAVTGSPAPISTPDSPPVVAVEMSGQQILLAAASTAETKSASGTYWHTKTDFTASSVGRAFPKTSSESWVRPDGRTWLASRSGNTVFKADPTVFVIADEEVSFAQLQKLPADPAALKAWIADKLTNTSGDLVIRSLSMPPRNP